MVPAMTTTLFAPDTNPEWRIVVQRSTGRPQIYKMATEAKAVEAAARHNTHPDREAWVERREVSKWWQP